MGTPPSPSVVTRLRGARARTLYPQCVMIVHRGNKRNIVSGQQKFKNIFNRSYDIFDELYYLSYYQGLT